MEAGARDRPGSIRGGTRARLSGEDPSIRGAGLGSGPPGAIRGGNRARLGGGLDPGRAASPAPRMERPRELGWRELDMVRFVGTGVGVFRSV